MNINKQKGFTLVEIAIVLVIIGLLLGGILKGQELINSARVRNLADQNSGIQAAYYGFIDRYRQVPGDFIAADATAAMGVTVNLPLAASVTDGNGRVEHTLEEAAAVWEQLSKSQFLGGGLTPATGIPADETAYADNAPKNAFNGSVILTRNNGYTGAAPSVRLNLHLGRNVPVTIARELDVKVDDGLPNTGVLRLAEPITAVAGVTQATSFDTINLATSFALCTAEAGAAAATDPAGDGSDITDIYDIFGDEQDCPQTFVY
jgi:prepilin-type N-terminal cleavage/methylation domain-containing protein